MILKMGRAKAGMELLSNKKSRRVAFQKRRKSLEKKARELSILCGIKVGLIIYGPKDNNDTPIELNIWPQDNTQDIFSLINSYKEENLENRHRRTTDLTMLYTDRTKKADEEFARLHRKNNEAKYSTWDEYDTLTSEELKQFGGLLEFKLESVRSRLVFMKGIQTYFSHSVSDCPSGMTDSIDHNHHYSQLQQSQDYQNPYVVQIIQQQQYIPAAIQSVPICLQDPLQQKFSSDIQDSNQVYD